MRRACLCILAVLLALTTRTARADEPVTLKREAPWDKWCVAPLCDSHGTTRARAPIVKVPAALDLAADTSGALETELKARITAEIQGLSTTALGRWDNKAMRDVAGALAAALAGDRERLRKVEGLGSCHVSPAS